MNEHHGEVRPPPDAATEMSRRLGRVVLSAMLLSLSSAGCYVPPLTSQIGRDDFATLRPGEDTRARVEAQLHHPDAFLSTSRWLGALKSRSRGTIIIPAGAQ